MFDLNLPFGAIVFRIRVLGLARTAVLNIVILNWRALVFRLCPSHPDAARELSLYRWRGRLAWRLV